MQNCRIIDACFCVARGHRTPRITADTFVALMATIETGSFATIIPESHRTCCGLEWARFIPMEPMPDISRVVLITPDRTPISEMAQAILMAARKVAGHN
jgi:hypothetical protein